MLEDIPELVTTIDSEKASFSSTTVLSPVTPAVSCSTNKSVLTGKKITQTSLTKFTMDKNTKGKIDKALAYFVSIDMLPYSLIEKDLKTCVIAKSQL